MKLSKQQAGYIHRSATDYRCEDCPHFVPEAQGCAIHKPSETILARGYCTYWVHGAPAGLEAGALGQLTRIESAYGEDPNGTKCSRCTNFDAGYCRKVDEKTPGDDPGRIDRNGCCNVQTPIAAGARSLVKVLTPDRGLVAAAHWTGH